MRRIYFIVLFLVQTVTSYSQIPEEQLSLIKQQLAKNPKDSFKVFLFEALGSGYRFSNVDSSLFYTEMGIQLANKNNMLREKAALMSLKGATLLESGRLPESLQFQFEAMNISEKLKDSTGIGFALNRIGNTYMELADYKKANDYYFLSKEIFRRINNRGMYYNEISNIGNIYELMGVKDSALIYQQEVYTASLKNKNNRQDFTTPEVMFRMGNAYKLNGDNYKALEFYKKGINEAYVDNDLRNLSMNTLFLAKLYNEMNFPDSALKYAYSTLNTGITVSFTKGIYEASLLISDIYKSKNRYDSAFKYMSIANVQKDSLTGARKFQQLQRIVLDEQQRQRELQARAIAVKNKERQYLLLAGLGIIAIIAVILFRNNKQKQKANDDLQRTVKDLKSTQAQLVQSEKMASLGELTAGIAHEIQNPLNFVNNFSEVNNELIEELKTQKATLNSQQQDEVLNDIFQNNVKINHHGRRADAIVKSMLQHSRTSNGVKEPTDINLLVDEYIRLAYHGLRAKDKSFSATLKTDFDDRIGKINIIPQDIGRVILNLINNSFYVVNEKKKKQAEGYEPTVSISTKKDGSNIVISVADNGNGIPQNVVDKIFQPFFTTKPTGEGTGLGLSLSYDIVKAHGGKLKVQTTQGEGSTFIIELPQVV